MTAYTRTIAMKPKITQQGKAQVANVNGDWLVLFPNGRIKPFATREEAEKAAARWFQSDARRRGLGVGIGQIDTDPNEDK